MGSRCSMLIYFVSVYEYLFCVGIVLCFEDTVVDKIKFFLWSFYFDGGRKVMSIYRKRYEMV